MDYRMIAFDFDGTLRAGNQPCISGRVVKALKAVQKLGIPVVIATGRSYGGLPKALLNGFRPDYYCCANGAQLLNSDGSEVAIDRMTPEEMYALVDYCEDYELPLGFTFTDAYYVYVGYQEMRDYYENTTGEGSICLDGEDMDHHLVEMPYGSFALMTREQADGFVQRYPHLDLQFFYYSREACDILHKSMNKTRGLRLLLERLGLDSAQLVAVGDGSNDADMLQFAGLGVAMGNASQELKNKADMVCAPDVEDGAAQLCRQLFPKAFC